jgi:hypothetical protein
MWIVGCIELLAGGGDVRVNRDRRRCMFLSSLPHCHRSSPLTFQDTHTFVDTIELYQ